MKGRRMPKQKRGESRQDYGTPPEFLRAVEQRFGPIGFDLAAHAVNSIAGERFYGPGSRHGENALAETWSDPLGVIGLQWLNPPFANIARWAEKCVEGQAQGARIAMLVPAGVGSCWYAEHVEPNAYVLAVRPRLTFVGERDPYPKDLILCYFDPARLRGFESWRWRP